MVINPTPKGSKIERVAACTARLETGRYLLPAAAPWLSTLCSELVSFPEGKKDDLVDALTQFLEFSFDQDYWVRQRYAPDGRPIRPDRIERRSRYYDGDAPSQGSW